MHYDEEGFLYPIVDDSLCIRCNICNKVCPVGDDKPILEAEDALSAYACWNGNTDELLKSSSGGVFSLLAHAIFARGGVVCGVVYDEQGTVFHDFATDASGLERMRGSKYVQSDLRDCFKHIKQYIKEKRIVLFSGTSCQVAGLKFYLGRLAEHDNLYCIELICGGTPSPKLLQSHFAHCCPDLKQINYFSFRDKKFGWSKVFYVKYTNEQGEENTFLEHAGKDPYIDAMFSAISLRPACYNCKFREGRAKADICIGDLWALPIIAPDARPPHGASSALIFSEKGQQLYNQASLQLAYNKKVSPLSTAINNGYYYRPPAIEQATRDAFFENFKQGLTLAQNMKAIEPLRHRVAILNHAGHSNHGSNLTAFALQEHLRRKGYDASTVSLRPYRCAVETDFRNFANFAYASLRFGQHIYGAADASKLNEHYQSFIAGSDQIWRYPQAEQRRAAFPAFMLEFAAAGKRRIAYAGSFGVDHCNIPEALKPMMQRGMDNYDAISAREHEGAAILDKEFGLADVPIVLDPVFLLSKRDWQRFSHAAADAESTGGVASYFFFSSQELSPAIQALATEQKLSHNALQEAQDTMSWLRQIELTECLVTDSFHALCFAIIYQRPFIAVSSPARGMSRIQSILDILGLTSRLINLESCTADELTARISQLYQEPINYSLVSEIIQRQSARSSQWLIDALQSPAKDKSYTIEASPQAIAQEYNVWKKSMCRIAKQHLMGALRSIIKGGRGMRHQLKQARSYWRKGKEAQ